MMAMDKVFESILLDVWVNMVCLVYRRKRRIICDLHPGEVAEDVRTCARISR